jgi:hypothetical protein
MLETRVWIKLRTRKRVFEHLATIDEILLM